VAEQKANITVSIDELAQKVADLRGHL